MIVELGGRAVYVYTGTRALDPARPTVVFVHGAGMDHTVWTSPARYFAHHGHNALAVDLPAHGASAGPGPLDIAGHAEWLGALLDSLGLGAALLVGHSMGALICLAAAARRSRLTLGVALLGVAVPMRVAPGLQAAADAGQHAAHDLITLWGHSASAQIGGGAHVPGMWRTGSALRLLERCAPGQLAADLRACDGYTEGLRDAAALRCPALLLHGAQDLMTPARAAAALAQALPEVRRVLLAGGGHMLMAEQPDAVLDALIDFAATLAPVPGPRAGAA